MKIKWLAHSSFLITSQGGTRIITDPYATGGGISYGEISETAEVVTVSHDHFDHNNVAAVKGQPQVVKEIGQRQAGGIDFLGVAAFHDEAKGSARGASTLFCFTVDGVRLCHCGDLGHTLTPEQVAEIGPVDVLLVPVGGTYTLDAAGAMHLCTQLNPRMVIPMHFKTTGGGLPIAGVDDFIKGQPSVRHVSGSEIEVTAGNLPPSRQIVVLTQAL